MNPLSYNIFFLNGTSAESDRTQIRTGNVYSKAADGSVTQSTESSTLSEPVYSAGTCTATGVVQEAIYQVYYTESAKGVYIIEDITLDLMLLDSIALEAQFCASGESSTPSARDSLFEQKFGLNFLVKRSGMEEYTEQEIAATGKI